MSDATLAPPAETAAIEPAAQAQTATTTEPTAPAAPAPTPAAAPKVEPRTAEPTRNPEGRIAAQQEHIDRLAMRRKEAEQRADEAERKLRQRDAELAIQRHAPGLSAATVAVLARGMEGAADVEAAAKAIAADLVVEPKTIVTTRAPGSQAPSIPDDPDDRLLFLLQREFGGG